jgi:hypothetical protein
MKTYEQIEFISYIETPRYTEVPIRIDSILEERMRVFLRARKARRLIFCK